MYRFIQYGPGWLAVLALVPSATMLGAGPDKSGYTFLNPTPRELRRELSTDRPDQTESPYTVDAGAWQLEMDLVNYTRDHDRSNGASVLTRDLVLAPLNLKLGLTNRVDLQLMMDPRVHRKVEDRRKGTSARASGFGDITTRLKINLWGNDGGSTAFAVMPFVKWPLSASDVRNGEMEGGAIFILGYELPRGWNSAIMTEVDFVADGSGGRATEWLNSLTFSRALGQRLGFYCEFVTVSSDAVDFRWQGQFDLGFTYALTDDVQLDGGCNFGLTRSAPDYQPFIGFSRRY